MNLVTVSMLSDQGLKPAWRRPWLLGMASWKMPDMPRSCGSPASQLNAHARYRPTRRREAHVPLT